MQDLTVQVWTQDLEAYKLLDSGDREKLEEIGGTRIARSEPRAWWRKGLPEAEWKKAESSFEKDINILDLKARVKYTKASKHIGIFPEQASEWQWIKEKVAGAGRPINVLNLFGYTGLASLAAAQAGAKVTHVDASKTSVAWARENQELSGLKDAPIRWIVDDAEDFVRREVKRGERYDAIIMDPPSYGKGPKGEVWKVEEDLPRLLDLCKQVLTDNPLFIILNMYSTELSSLSLKNLLGDMMKGNAGNLEAGELAIKQEGSERLLPLSIFAIWNKS
ncbi:class I SAM-dependent methyltransferase [Candidatus Parcubacteria bacterium]|nr:class I SAM-dependent methyltransferase [Candidatus Parcubacteria bacterium]